MLSTTNVGRIAKKSFADGVATFLSADLSFLSAIPVGVHRYGEHVFTVTAERCSPLRRKGVHRYDGKVFTVTANTNDSQEKNDKSLEKSIATAEKNANFCRGDEFENA